LTSTTRDKVDAAAPSSPSAAVESDQLGSALGASDSSTQRMSPAEWTAMTTVVKSSTSASACDHTSGKLHLTESLGSVGRCVRQTRYYNRWPPQPCRCGVKFMSTDRANDSKTH